jgi:hypothetical protein
LLLASVFSAEAFAQAMPTIETRGDARYVTFHVGAKPTLDGQGNIVGTISNMTITVVEVQPPKTHYSIDYDFYNGSGTWRGSQAVIAQFKNKDNGTLTQVSFPLDRGHCVYGGPERRHVEGTMENIISLINHVDVDVTRVSGVQTGC